MVPSREAGDLADPARMPDAVEAAVTHPTRGLALVNFRREPVYLADDLLERQPRYHRYAIGCRKFPDSRGLRAALLGRAIHSSIETWTAQAGSVLGHVGA